MPRGAQEPHHLADDRHRLPADRFRLRYGAADDRRDSATMAAGDHVYGRQNWRRGDRFAEVTAHYRRRARGALLRESRQGEG